MAVRRDENCIQAVGFYCPIPLTQTVQPASQQSRIAGVIVRSTFILYPLLIPSGFPPLLVCTAAAAVGQHWSPFRSFSSEEKENESRVTSETFLRLLLPLPACCLPVLLPPLLARSPNRPNVVTCLPHFSAITALLLLLLLAPFPGDAVWRCGPGAAQISGIA